MDFEKFDALSEAVATWGRRNFEWNGPNEAAVGLVEEAGEIAHAVLKRWQGIRYTPVEADALEQDGLADLCIYLANLWGRRGDGLATPPAEFERVFQLIRMVGDLTLHPVAVDREEVEGILRALDRYCRAKGWSLDEIVDRTWARVSMPNDRWELIFGARGGHRYFREKATGRVAIADDSGEWPEECDGGPLFVDTREALRPSPEARFFVPLVGGNHAIAGVQEACELAGRVGQPLELVGGSWRVTIEPDEAAMVALRSLVETIEATGGVEPYFMEDGYAHKAGDPVVPVADAEWVDLGAAYLAACRALGRTPVFAGDDEDDDEEGEDDDGSADAGE